MRWVVLANLLGCLGFMAAAVLAIFLPGGDSKQTVNLSLGFTLLGAICFFVGSVLMLPETASEELQADEALAHKQ